MRDWTVVLISCKHASAGSMYSVVAERIKLYCVEVKPVQCNASLGEA